MMDTSNNTAYGKSFLITSIIIHIEPQKDTKYSFTKIFHTAQRHFAPPVDQRDRLLSRHQQPARAGVYLKTGYLRLTGE